MKGGVKKIILTVPGCGPCVQLKAEYPGVPTLELGRYPQVRFALQVLLNQADLAAPMVVAIVEGNGREARKLLDLEE